MTKSLLDLCPKCQKYSLIQMVNVIVVAPASQRSLGKKALRSKNVKVAGVDWPRSRVYCGDCGYHERT